MAETKQRNKRKLWALAVGNVLVYMLVFMLVFKALFPRTGPLDVFDVAYVVFVAVCLGGVANWKIQQRGEVPDFQKWKLFLVVGSVTLALVAITLLVL